MPTTQLSWQPGYTLSRKPIKRSIARRTKVGAPRSANRLQQFEFIAEQPAKHYEADRSLPVVTSMHIEPSIEPAIDCQISSDNSGVSLFLAKFTKDQDFIVSDEHRVRCEVEAISGIEPSVETLDRVSSDTFLIESGEPLDSVTTYGTNTRRPYSCWSEDRYAAQLVPGSSIDSQLQKFARNNIDLDIPPGILYNSLSHRFRPILDRYNREFCKIPLTSDLQMNPFRYRTDLDPEPTFLVHAVMALAGHHVESTSTQYHRHTALQSLRGNLDTYNNATDCYSMVDTIIILFSFDETQSTLGNWSTHLQGAYSLFEACGGIEEWATSARAKAQVGMLTWWDAITSLVNREDCVFPYAYFEAAISNHGDRQWDYYGLCGCPPSLVKIAMQLARLSAEKRKSSSMRYVTFDNTVVSELEQSLESWYHVSPPTAFRDEGSMHQDQDGMHCSEAWRNGLLLYIYRVFWWELGECIPIRILYRARIILDHVFACRDESMVSRQALLPLFFAGCELRDQSSRTKIIDFCSVWDKRTRYHMFSSTIPLLEDVWAKQELEGFENVWWGQVVDAQHMPESRSSLQMRLCFG